MLLERRTGREADEFAEDLLGEDERMARCASALDHLNTVAIFQRMNGGRPDGVGADNELRRAAVIFDQSATYYAAGLTRERLDQAVERDALTRTDADRIARRLPDEDGAGDMRKAPERDGH
ncbi:hypothetical protein [Hyphomonas sp.]|uniref:hypothetical protein n=1 Tax=Hyphomonas sp. TaxID=87 RepID=UPI0032428137